jgi:type I restriction enzyme S subunit
MSTKYNYMRLGDICKINLLNITDLAQYDFVNYLDTGNITENHIDNIQLITGNDKLPSRARRRAEVGDIIYSTVRPNQRHYGIIQEVIPNLIVSTAFAVITPQNSLADNFFIYYYLTQRSIVEKLQNIGEQSVSTYPSIKPSDIENIEIFLPPIGEQRKISRILKNLDDKILQNDKINHNLEQLVQTIFKEWFIDYKPFREIPFIDSELGRIPTGWCVETIENLAEKVAMGPFGSNIKVETFVKSGIPIISGKHLRGIYLEELDYNFITEEHACNLSNSLVHAGDIIFTHAGNIGQVALIPDDCNFPYYIISQRQFYLRCNKTKALPEYINYYFHNREGQVKLLANATQTGVPSIARPSSYLKTIAIVLPPMKVQLKWLGKVKAMLQTMTINNKMTQKIKLIRDSLLPYLMSGDMPLIKQDDMMP